jgi:hypothetical protein
MLSHAVLLKVSWPHVVRVGSWLLIGICRIWLPSWILLRSGWIELLVIGGVHLHSSSEVICLGRCSLSSHSGCGQGIVGLGHGSLIVVTKVGVHARRVANGARLICVGGWMSRNLLWLRYLVLDLALHLSLGLGVHLVRSHSLLLELYFQLLDAILTILQLTTQFVVVFPKGLDRLLRLLALELKLWQLLDVLLKLLVKLLIPRLQLGDLLSLLLTLLLGLLQSLLLGGMGSLSGLSGLLGGSLSNSRSISGTRSRCRSRAIVETWPILR